MAVLTISRQFGSGGTEIGRAVANQTGYEYVDRERILEDLRKVGPKWEEWAQELDGHCPTVWERNDWSFRGFSSLVQSEILEYATRGNAVIMGRGANFLLEGIRHAYRIRIVAPLEFRVKRVASRESLDLDMARWLVKKTDEDRLCFVHSIYGRQQDDPAGYDEVIEVRGQEFDDVVRAVREVLTERDKGENQEARQVLSMRAAAARVKAGIATNPAFFVPILDVVVEGNGLVARGVIHSARERRRLEEEAVRLAGSIPVRFELHYRL